jgi:hypothetical protein
MLRIIKNNPLLTLVAAGSLLAGAQSALAQTRSDSQIQADVNSKLQADPKLSDVTVGVGVQGGVVTLTGNVAQEDQLNDAENDISDIQGITKIVDNLQVNATAPAASAPANAQNEAAMAAQNAAPPAGDQGQATPPPPSGAQGDQHYTYNNPDADNLGGSDQGGQPGQDQGGQPGPPNGAPMAGNAPPPPPGSYGNAGYGNGGYNQQRYPRRPRPVRYDPGNRPVTLPMGSVLTVRTLEPLQAGVTPAGSFFKAVVAQDVQGDQGVAIPRGTAVTGQVIESKKAGHFKGAAVLKLKLTNLSLGAQNVALPTDTWGEYIGGKGGQTTGNAIGGAAFGALLGAVVGGGEGAAIGAGAGAVGGAASTGLDRDPHAYVPAEGLVSFRLTAPITVTTVTPDQARLLANAAPPMQQPPVRRPPPPPGYYYGPYGPYYR